MISRANFAGLTPIYSGPFSTVLFGTLASEWLIGTATDETFYGDPESASGFWAASDLIQGGSGDDMLVGDADQLLLGSRGADDLLDGGKGIDHLYGDARYLIDSYGGNDVLYGGDDRDYLFGDAGYAGGNSICGSDELYGGAGDDEAIVGDAGLLYGNAVGGADRLEGGSGTDELYGDSLAMTENARGGDDIIVGGAGDDKLWGDSESYNPPYYGAGGGADRFIFDVGSGSDRIGDFEVGKDLIQILPGYGFHDFGDILARIRDDASGNAVIHLNGVTDQITLLGVSSASLSAADFLFSDEIITGSSGNNQINPTTSVLAYRTTALHDAIFGMDGNDVIDGGGGADLMNGGAGNDTYFVDIYSANGVSADDDQIVEAANGGIDTVNASVSFRIGANVENLTLIGTATINGTGNELDNVITGNSAANGLEGGLGNDHILGANGDDRITGGGGNDWIEGGKGNDVLNGQDGDDVLDGGSGKDTAFGGAGRDHFVFNFGDTAITSLRLDSIGDFHSGEDVIDLGILQGGLSPSAYAEGSITSNNFNAAASAAQGLMNGGQSVVFIAGTTDGWVFWDGAGADGILDQAIKLVGINSMASIDAGDFV